MSRIQGALRELVRQRAEQQCEYCRLPEAFGVYSFQVDHIIAQKHHGDDDPANLAWACFPCNHAKGSDIASYDPVSRQIFRLYHPRQDIWADQFELLLTGVIQPRTAIGRVTADLLQLNDPQRVALRALLLTSGLG